MKNKPITSLSVRKFFLTALVVTPLAILPSPLWALPANQTLLNAQISAVTSGVSVTSNSGTFVSVVSPDRGVIKWVNFGDGVSMTIGTGDTINYALPSSSAAVLNMVVGPTGGPIAATTIGGTITSNGIVYIMNPTGIVISSGAVITTAGLGLSTTQETEFPFETTGTLSYTGATGTSTVPANVAINNATVNVGTTGNVFLTGNGVNVSGTMTAGALNVTAKAQPTLTASGNVLLGVTGALTLGAVGTVDLLGNITPGTGNLTVTTAGGNIDVANAAAVTIFGGNATLTTNTGNVVQTSGNTFTVGDTQNNGLLTINAGTGLVTMGKISTPATNTKQLAVAIPLAGATTISSTNDIGLNASTINGNLSVTSTGGSIASNGNVTVAAGNTISLSATTAQKTITFKGPGDLTFAALSSSNNTGNNITLTSTTGSITLPALGTSIGNMTVTAQNNISQGTVGGLTVNNATTGTATFDAVTGSISLPQAANAFTKLVIKDAPLGATINSGAGMILASGTNAAGTVAITAGGNVVFGNAAGDAVTFNSTLNLSTTGSITDVTDKTTVIGALTMTATGNILLDGNVGNGIGLASKYGQINVTTASNVTVWETTTLNLGTINTPGGLTAVSTGGDIINTGQLLVGGDVIVAAGTAAAPGNISLNYSAAAGSGNKLSTGAGVLTSAVTLPVDTTLTIASAIPTAVTLVGTTNKLGTATTTLPAGAPGNVLTAAATTLSGSTTLGAALTTVAATTLNGATTLPVAQAVAVNPLTLGGTSVIGTGGLTTVATTTLVGATTLGAATGATAASITLLGTSTVGTGGLTTVAATTLVGASTLGTATGATAASITLGGTTTLAAGLPIASDITLVGAATLGATATAPFAVAQPIAAPMTAPAGSLLKTGSTVNGVVLGADLTVPVGGQALAAADNLLAGSTLAAGTVIPATIVLKATNALPAGTTLAGATILPATTNVPATTILGAGTIVGTGDLIGAGSVLTGATVLAAGTNVPAATILGAGTIFGNGDLLGAGSVLNGATILATTTNLPAGTILGKGTILGISNVLPAATIIPSGTVIPTGTTIPGGTIIGIGTALPAGTIIPASTTLPAGTVIAAGNTLPVGASLQPKIWVMDDISQLTKSDPRFASTIGNYLAKSLTVVTDTTTFFAPIKNAYGTGLTGGLSVTTVQGAQDVNLLGATVLGGPLTIVATGGISASNGSNSFATGTFTAAGDVNVSSTIAWTPNATLTQTSGTHVATFTSGQALTIGTYTSNYTGLTTFGTGNKQTLSDSVAGISIYGNTALTSNGAINITKSGHNFGGLTITTGNDNQATVTESGTMKLQSVSTGKGSLTLTSTNGDIIQDQTVGVQKGITMTDANGANKATFSAVNGKVTLDNTDDLNAWGDVPVSVTALGDVVVNSNRTDLTLGNITTSGKLSVNVIGGTVIAVPLTQAGLNYLTPPTFTISAPDALSVANGGTNATAVATVNAADGSLSITITNFGAGYSTAVTPTITVTSPGTFIGGVQSVPVVFGTVTSGTGYTPATLGIAGIKQASGTKLYAYDTTTFKTINGPVTVNNTGNQFGGLVLSAGSGNIGITEKTTLNLKSVQTTGNFAATSEGGDIISTTDAAVALNKINVGGTTGLTASNGAISAYLANSDFVGVVSLVSKGDVQLLDTAGALTLGSGSSVGGNLTARTTATGGVINQNGPITVTSNALFDASQGSVGMTDTGNKFGSIRFIAGTGGVTITQATNMTLNGGSFSNGAVQLGTTGNFLTTGPGGASINSSLVINAGGTITPGAGSLTVIGTFTVISNSAIDLSALSLSGNLLGKTPTHLGTGTYVPPSP
jgi:fibronectin-binding autotransporter adhesin